MMFILLISAFLSSILSAHERSSPYQHTRLEVSTLHCYSILLFNGFFASNHATLTDVRTFVMSDFTKFWYSIRRTGKNSFRTNLRSLEMKPQDLSEIGCKMQSILSILTPLGAMELYKEFKEMFLRLSEC